MKLYFAPIDGVTGRIYRNAFTKFFVSPDKYFAPFISPCHNPKLKGKEIRELLPENNENINLVPQIMANNPEYFIKGAKQLQEMGYKEVNLNAGCPSGTVVPKGRGAGFLDQPEKLQSFLEEIFQKADYAISIKTRIGMYEPEEFHRLLAIYNEYPIRELIIHPRTRQEFYKEKIHPEIFKYAYEHSKNPITFNGEIRSLQVVTALEKEYPAMKNIMIGRGLIAKPGFIMQAADGSLTENRTRSKKRLKEFLDCLLEEYRKVMSADIHALFKMKEIWIYMAPYFTNYEKYLKKIKKTDKLMEYRASVSSLMTNEDIIE